MGSKTRAAGRPTAKGLSDEGRPSMDGGGDQKAALLMRFGEAVDADQCNRSGRSAKSRPQGPWATHADQLGGPDESGIHDESDASLQVYRRLGGPWWLLSLARFIPRFIRNPAYRVIARNRYRWFGKRDACRIPSAEERSR